MRGGVEVRARDICVHEDRDSCIFSTIVPSHYQEITWTPYAERRAQASFLAGAVHPAFGAVGYIADGTKSAMRNPTEVYTAEVLQCFARCI